jgi:hypothetical protein
MLVEQINLISQFEDHNKFYWIKVLVREEEINQVEAGYLINYFRL